MPARISVQTKRTKKPWSDLTLLSFLCLPVCPCVSPTKMRKKENGADERKPTKPRCQCDQYDLSLLSPSISVLCLHAVAHPRHQLRLMDRAEEVAKEGCLPFYLFPSLADI